MDSFIVLFLKTIKFFSKNGFISFRSFGCLELNQLELNFPKLNSKILVLITSFHSFSIVVKTFKTSLFDLLGTIRE